MIHIKKSLKIPKGGNQIPYIEEDKRTNNDLQNMHIKLKNPTKNRG